MGKRFRRIAAVSIIGVVIAGGAGTAYAALSSAGPAYRLARVTSADETAALHTVGTLTPARQAGVAFTVSGTVAAVRVRPGQHVTAGQELGALDTTPLKAQLTMAQSDLARANLQADRDEASQNTAAAGSASSPGSQPASSLRRLQQAVLSAQRKADTELARAKTALGRARRACAAPPPSTIPSPSPSPGTTLPSPGTALAPASPAAAAATGTALPTTTRTARSPASPAPACADATQRVLSAETAVLRAQQVLSGQLTALDKALSTAVAAASKPSAGGDGSSTPGGSTRDSGSARGGGGDGSGGAASAVQLAADQASADAAAAQVTVAQQNLAAATVVSPISGTVVTVGVTAGSSAGAGSTAFVVAGLDRYQVVTEVAVDDMPELRAGQQASVLPDGMSTPLSGSVISIGLVPDTSGSSAAYPVTIGLTDPPAGLHAGSFADVTIITARASGVSVPTSAVHYSGRLATVTVYAGGRARVVRVTVGTKGPVMTRITSGLRIGQQVVLADLSKPLPTDSQFSGRGSGPPFGGSVQVIGPG